MDDLGKNVDDHGASCLVGPSAAGMLAGVDGRVVRRPAEQGIFCSIHEQAKRQSEENWEQPWRITATALLGEALMAVETRARAKETRSCYGNWSLCGKRR